MSILSCKPLTPLNLNGLLELLNGKDMITVYVACRTKGTVSEQRLKGVVPLYVSPYGLWSDDTCSYRVGGWSLIDAGIMPNNYNQHQTFATVEEANRYAGKCQCICCSCCRCCGGHRH